MTAGTDSECFFAHALYECYPVHYLAVLIKLEKMVSNVMDV